MTIPKKIGEDRRRFLKSAIRSLALGAMAALGVTQFLKRRRLAETCTEPDPCHGCRAFSSCGKPKARAARKTSR